MKNFHDYHEYFNGMVVRSLRLYENEDNKIVVKILGSEQTHAGDVFTVRFDQIVICFFHKLFSYFGISRTLYFQHLFPDLFSVYPYKRHKRIY